MGCDKSHISTVKFWKPAYKGMKKREEKKFYCSSSSKEHIKLSQRRTMELFSALQLKYSRNRRLKCDLILHATPERKCTVGFLNNLPVGSGFGDSLKTLSIIITYKLLNTKEKVKLNRTWKAEYWDFGSAKNFTPLLHLSFPSTIWTLPSPPQKPIKYVLTIYRVGFFNLFSSYIKYQWNCCLSTLHCHMNTQKEEREFYILLSSEFS